MKFEPFQMFKNGQSILSFSNYIVSLINYLIINFQLSMESHSNIFFSFEAYVVAGE